MRLKAMRHELSDEEWLQFDAVLPKEKRRQRGRPCSVDLRGVMNGICFLVKTGCAWRDIPPKYGFWYTCYRYFTKWAKTRVWYKVQKLLHRKYRKLMGYNKYPTTARIDSQVVKTGRTAPIKSKDCRNYRRIKGRKRHMAVDSFGIPIAIKVSPKIAEYDGNVAPSVMSRAMKYVNQRGFTKIYADGHYRGDFVAWSNKNIGIEPTITTGLANVKGEKQPNGRWVVERSFAWTDDYRRLSIDRENKLLHSKCMVRVAAIKMLLGRIGKLIDAKKRKPAELHPITQAILSLI